MGHWMKPETKAELIRLAKAGMEGDRIARRLYVSEDVVRSHLHKAGLKFVREKWNLTKVRDMLGGRKR